MSSLGLILGVGEKIIDKFFHTQEEKDKGRQAFLSLVKEGELKELELLVQDRNSARQREMALGGRVNSLLALFILSGFFGIVGALFLLDIEENVKEPLYILLGSLGTMATQVVAYYFGSSQGSKQKTFMLGQ